MIICAAGGRWVGRKEVENRILDFGLEIGDWRLGGFGLGLGLGLLELRSGAFAYYYVGRVPRYVVGKLGG